MKFLLYLIVILVDFKPTKAECDFQFCGGLGNIPDLSVLVDVNLGDPVTEQKSCALLYDEVAAGIYDTLECEGSIKLFENMCCPASATTRQCFLCGENDASFNVQKAFAGVGSCTDFNNRLGALPAGELCNDSKSSGPLDIQSFCECPDAVTTNSCNICGDNQEINASAPIPEVSGLVDLTCGDVRHVTNETLCAEFTTPNITASCCMEKNSGGIGLSIGSLATALIVGLAFTR